MAFKEPQNINEKNKFDIENRGKTYSSYSIY